MNQPSRHLCCFFGCLPLLGCVFIASADRAEAWGGHDVVMQAVADRLRSYAGIDAKRIEKE